MATHELGPANGTLKVNTYREGVAQKIGHDLVIEVERWSATLGVGPDGAITAIVLNADSSTLQVREGHNGLKALTYKDRTEIRKGIDEKVLRGRPITFTSTAVAPRVGGLAVDGELTLVDTTRPASFDVDVSGDGHVAGTLQVTQSEWGIKPYKAFLGALKVSDVVEIVLDVRLPAP